MGLTSLPVAADVAALLLECGVPQLQIDAQNLDRAVEVAVESLEADTGFRPFLTAPDAPEVEMKFSAPRSATLELKTGFVSITKVEFKDAFKDAFERETLIEDEDFETRPFNALSWNEPITEIKFFCVFSPRVQVVITGRLGYATQISQRVFDAILRRAALHVAPQLKDAMAAVGASTVNQVKARETGDTRIEFTTSQDAKILSSAVAFWQSFYSDVVNELKLRVWGF